MIALDTNVLVRYLVDDEPVEQCECAAALIEGTHDSGTPIFLSNIVLCELVWVLESCYGLPDPKIADTLENLYVGLDGGRYAREHKASLR